ncbi:MAG: NAD-dependent epimerase/dehydratase family protein [Bryobacteraceae bacterium]|jgi:predicted dehydrogenase/nucleoside-diphosphate-sugar epimerase
MVPPNQEHSEQVQPSRLEPSRAQTRAARPNRRIRAAIVGAGYVANHHLRALRGLPFVDIVGIADQDAARAAQAAVNFSKVVAYGNLADMLASKPDVVHVLTPPASHCALTVEALEMGCHVFVEKPMAETAEECDRMIAAARANGRILSVNHSARFDPVVLRAAEWVKRGLVGDVVAVHFLRSSDYPPYAGGPLPAPYRQGSYPFRDLGVHGFYLMELFLGPLEEMRVTYGESGRDPLLTFDEWRAEVRGSTGSGYMFLSWNSRPIQNELLIHGTRGVMHLDCFLQTCRLSRTLPGPKQIGMVIEGTRNALLQSFAVPWNMLRFASGRLKPSPGIYRGVQDFYRALAARLEPPVSMEEGRRAIAWVARSSREADAEKAERIATAAAQQLPPARILVTGGGGFLGRALVERLRQNPEPLRLLLRRPPPAGSAADPAAPGAPLSIVYGSLGQPDVVDRAVAGVDLVFHLGAAMKGPKEEFQQGTVWGTRNIVEACLRHQVSRLVYVSSMGVLDHAGHAAGDPVTETSPLEPFPDRRGAYTQTKLEAEQIVLDAAARRRLPAVVIRPGQIFGPGAEDVTPNGVIGIAGRWIVAGNGHRNLPLVYRDDVVDGLLQAAESEAALGRIVNLVDPAPIDQNQYLAACGRKKVMRMPVWLLLGLASLVELLGKILKRGVPLSRYRVRSLQPLHPFDLTAAATLLNWRPRVGASEGLKRTFPAQAASTDDGALS